jgi:peptidoglycan hydrolase-like protein with peptidoglycan-binding domain
MALLSSRLKNNARLRSTEANGKQAIGKGERDKEAVALLQSCMEELGFKFVRSKPRGRRLDGVFGEETEEIIKRFQRQQSLKPDGLVGPKTLGVLDAIYVAFQNADAVRLAIELRAPGSGWEMT